MKGPNVIWSCILLRERFDRFSSNIIEYSVFRGVGERGRSTIPYGTDGYGTGTKQCCGSRMFIADPGSEFFPFRIPDPGSKRFPDPGSGSAYASKEFKYFNQKFIF